MSTPMEIEHKQVIVLRKDLNMRKGKMVAQCAHASMGTILGLSRLSSEGDDLIIPLDERIRPWLTGRFKKICVSVNSEDELLELYARAKAAGMVCSLILDSGLTEFGGVPTHTAVAIGPDRSDVVDQLTGQLPLL
jgi:PTH2 family peptidyl-tRNA hydrolase